MRNSLFSTAAISLLLAGSRAPLAAAPIIVNGNFSANANQYVVWPGYAGRTALVGTGTNPASLTGWTGSGNFGVNGSDTPIATGSSDSGGAGIGGRSTPFADNGNTPPAVAFMQNGSPTTPDTLSQTVGGFAVGQQYVLQFDYNVRGSSNETFTTTVGSDATATLYNVTPVGGSNPYYHEIIPFTATSANEQIQVSSFATRNVDSTLLLSNFQVTAQHLVPVANANFTADATPAWPGSHSITGWTGGSGLNPSSGAPGCCGQSPFAPDVLGNGQPGQGTDAYGVTHTGATGVSPTGTPTSAGQFAYLQVDATTSSPATNSLSQVLTGLQVGSTYTVSYYDAHRMGDSGTGATLAASINGVTDLTTTPSNTQWIPRSFSFVATSATETLMFTATNIQGTNTVPNDQTLDIAGVAVFGPPAPEPSTFVLGGLGLVGLMLAARRRRRKV